MHGDSCVYLQLSEGHESLLSPPLGKEPSSPSPHLKSELKFLPTTSPYKTHPWHPFRIVNITSLTSTPIGSECFRTWNPEVCVSKYSLIEADACSCPRTTDVRVPSLFLKAWGREDVQPKVSSKHQVSCPSLQFLKPWVSRWRADQSYYSTQYSNG